MIYDIWYDMIRYDKIWYDMIWCRSQGPRSLRRRSAAALLLRSWVRIPPGAWMFVCCVCCVLSGRGLCEGADHSSRGVLPTVVRRCVWSRYLKNGKAMTRVGSQRHRKKMIWYNMVCYGTIYLTAFGWPRGGSSTAHIYIQTIQRTTQNKQYTEQHKN